MKTNQNVIFISDNSFNELSEKEKLDLIQPEIDLIRSSFSKEQINLLKTHLIDGEQSNSCIYGLLSGHCNNVEVVDIITKLPVLVSNYYSVEESLYLIKGDYLLDDNYRVSNRTLYFMTPLEEYITPEDGDYRDDDSDEDGINYSQDYYDEINKIIKKIKHEIL